MVWLRVHTTNGKDYYQIVFDYKKGNEFLLGTERYIPITDAEAALGLDQMILRYKEEQEALKKKQNPTKEEIEEWEKAKKAHDDLVNRIIRIIRKSHHKGEVESAKGFYEKITGNKWKD